MISFCFSRTSPKKNNNRKKEKKTNNKKGGRVPKLYIFRSVDFSSFFTCQVYSGGEGGERERGRGREIYYPALNALIES